MNQQFKSTITSLVLQAFDKVKVTGAEWRTSLKVGSSRLERLRAGRTTLTDAELDRIAEIAGEPWESLVLRVLGNGSAITSDTRELIALLHALRRTAEAEATAHGRRQKSRVSRTLSARLRSGYKVPKSSKPLRAKV